MKLTCVLIIAVLFLTAITADDSKDKQVYRAVGLTDKMRRVRASDSCAERGAPCRNRRCCPDLICVGGHVGRRCRCPDSYYYN
uniref:Conotoxin superfamily O1 n=1 Tax=Conus magus TaxID=6492 RepID=A0A5P8I0L7_CONMA|nr:conotoxin superfamily O1 [Conus magus]